MKAPRLPPLLSSLTRLLLLCLAIGGPSLVLSQKQPQATITPYDCVDPNNRELTYLLRRGENTTVCLYIGPDGDWNSKDVKYKRFTFNMIADEFSSYEIPKSFLGVAPPAGSPPSPFLDASHVFVASQASLSFLRRYDDKTMTPNRIYPFLTAIIDVEDGVIRGIAWDDACVFCEKKECVANTYNFNGSVATADQTNQPVDGCYLTRDECMGFAATGSNKCDIKIYVAWTGTDADGNVLLSSGSRFSMFPPNRVQENVNNQVDSMIEGVKNIKDKISSIGTRLLKREGYGA